MWLYYKAIKEADRYFNEHLKPKGEYYTAEFAIGYALTHHSLFMLEILVEAIIIVALIMFFV